MPKVQEAGRGLGVKTNVEKIHEQISTMSLGDTLLLCGQAANLPMPREKLTILLK